MLRVSKLADYAVVILVRLDRLEGQATASRLSLETRIPEPTVSKLLKMLAAGGFVKSFRGARSGYRLMRSLNAVSAGEVIAAVDGPVALVACCDSGFCLHMENCDLHGRWDPVNDAIRKSLGEVFLSRMAAEKTFALQSEKMEEAGER